MTWEELFLALQQVYQTDKDQLKKKVTVVFSADECVLLDLVVSAQKGTILLVPDYDGE